MSSANDRLSLYSTIFKELASYDFNNDFKKIKAPAMILYGDHEVGAGIAGRLYHANVKNPRMVLAKNSGHFPFIENRKEFLDIIFSFLAAYN